MNSELEIATNLPNLPAAVIVSEIDTDKAEDMVDREGFTSVSFTSIPEEGFEAFKDIAKARKMFPRDLFGDGRGRAEYGDVLHVGDSFGWPAEWPAG